MKDELFARCIRSEVVIGVACHGMPRDLNPIECLVWTERHVPHNGGASRLLLLTSEEDVPTIDDGGLGHVGGVPRRYQMGDEVRCQKLVEVLGVFGIAVPMEFEGQLDVVLS
jgi:hypothetical protein